MAHMRPPGHAHPAIDRVYWPLRLIYLPFFGGDAHHDAALSNAFRLARLTPLRIGVQPDFSPFVRLVSESATFTSNP